MIIGMDFGTTNSGMARYDGQQLQVIPFGAGAGEGAVTRTALYVTNDQTVTIGREAIERYQAHNLGRPVRMERTKIGVITFVSEATFWDDIYSERDVLAPGRLFLSFKSSLSSVGYKGTSVGSLFYAIEDIVALYLSMAKLRAEQHVGQRIDSIVLGRPVHFASDPEADALAEQRLVAAAWRAGYETVYLQYEPVAVALHYATTLREEQRVLVFDFGGGTLDLAVMALDGRGQARVLATGGIPVAGDLFDQRVVRSKLAARLGEGSHFGPRNRRRVVPSWIYDDLANWQTIALLQATRHQPLLNELLATSDQPAKIGPLVEIVTQNYGLALFDAVERTKRILSERPEAVIDIVGERFAIHEPLARQEFALLINQEVRAVEGLIGAVVREAGLALSDIDMVVRTGGSSQIPVFVDLLQRTFGAERVRAVDTFASVTAGLGVMAHRIGAGLDELPAHQRPNAASESQAGRSATMELLGSWIAAQEQAARGEDSATPSLVQLGGDGHVRAATLPADWSSKGEPLPLPNESNQGARQAVLATLDEQLLVVTTAYRLLLTTPRKLLVLQEHGVRLGDLERFAPGERVGALARWGDLAGKGWLAVVNAQGDMRLLDLPKLREALGRALPTQLEGRPAGGPVALLGLDDGQQVVIVTAAARAGRIVVEAANAPGFQAMGCEKRDAVVAALPLDKGDERLLLVAASGVLRVVRADDVPLVIERGERGRVVAPRLAVQGAALHNPAAHRWLVTSARLLPLAGFDAKAASRSHVREVPLGQGEQINALVGGPAD